MPEQLAYPRMLFRGDETCVVQTADERAVKELAGWVARRLPWEPPAPEIAAPVERPKGRKPKE